MDATGFWAQLDALFQTCIVAPLGAFFFFDLAFWDDASGDAIRAPLVVVWLLFGAAYFTLRLRFVSLRRFGHAVECMRGRYTRPDAAGEISHFQALAAALSGTVGLGNIAGVAVAIGTGGPGAAFWMVVAGFLGMSSKLAECTLGQLYRVERSDGHVSGGAMHYLREGLAGRGLPRAGRALSVGFALMCIGGSFGGGNMFQANQTYAQLASDAVFPALRSTSGSVLFGAILALAVGLVIVGGIRRIGEVASTLVPFMCGLYLACGLWILLAHAAQVPAALASIVREAFSWRAGAGGFVGVLVQGFRRAMFSNEAGTGSSAIIHSAARTDEPMREGMVALLEPFVDTLVVCSMTALVVVVTGAWKEPGAGSGIQMTSWAFATVFPWFPWLLTITALLFAYSTMISWSYYGEQCWAHLFGVRRILLYKLLFLVFTWLGAIFEPKAVLEFGDMMILGMAFPNMTGLLLLSGRLVAEFDSYWSRLRSGAFPRYG